MAQSLLAERRLLRMLPAAKHFRRTRLKATPTAEPASKKAAVINPLDGCVTAAPSPNDREGSNKSEAASQKYPWIVNAPVDLLFCCGGIVWILFAVHYFVLGPSGGAGNGLGQMLAISTIAGTHALGETHIAATLARIYKTPQSVRRFAPYTIWAAATCLFFAIAGLFVDGSTCSRPFWLRSI